MGKNGKRTCQSLLQIKFYLPKIYMLKFQSHNVTLFGNRIAVDAIS